MKLNKVLLVLLVVATLFASGCADQTAEEEEMEEPEMEEMNIVETAVSAGSFDTLVTAVQAAGLEETLSGEGPFTVFAPTDEAFAALPEGTLDSLLADEEALAAVLTYHVVAGEAMSGDLSDGMTIMTVQGEEVTITITDGAVMVNDANVVTADIETSNWVIHVIDKVILPPSMTS